MTGRLWRAVAGYLLTCLFSLALWQSPGMEKHSFGLGVCVGASLVLALRNAEKELREMEDEFNAHDAGTEGK